MLWQTKLATPRSTHYEMH